MSTLRTHLTKATHQKRKIALFVGKNLVADIMLNQLVPEMLEMGFKPVIYRTEYSSSPKSKLPPLQDYAFYEGVMVNEVIYSFLERQNTPDNQPNLSPKQLGEKYGVAVKPVLDVNDPVFYKSLEEDPFLVGAISVRNYQIFKPDIIDTLRKRGFFWNFHMGILPEYGGVYIPARSIMAGEALYGWTLHHVTQGIDKGNIIAQFKLPLYKEKTLFSTYLDAVPMGTTTLFCLLCDYNVGYRPEGQKQLKKDIGYFSFLTEEELRELIKNGMRFVDSQEMLEAYLSHFSYEDSPHRNLLERTIMQEIGNWKRGITAQAAARYAECEMAAC